MENLYLDMKKRHQEEVNAFPMGFAFDNKQLEEQLTKLNATIDDVVSIGGGGFIRKKDADAFKELFQRIDDEEKAMYNNEEYLYQMFFYELANHEYCITYDVEETLEALGLTIEEVKGNELMLKAFKKARKDYLANCDEC